MEMVFLNPAMAIMKQVEIEREIRARGRSVQLPGPPEEAGLVSRLVARLIPAKRVALRQAPCCTCC